MYYRLFLAGLTLKFSRSFQSLLKTIVKLENVMNFYQKNKI